MTARAGLLADERGVSAVEFGLLLVPLCVSILGLLDVGYMMYVRSNLQGGLNDVARIASVENPQFTVAGATTDAKINTAIQSRLAHLVSGGTYTISKKSYYQFSRVGRPEKLTTDVNNNGQHDLHDCWRDDNGNGTFDTDSGKTGIGGAEDVVLYRVTVSTPRITPAATLIGLPANYTITASTSIRNQPFDDRAAPQIRCS